MSLPSRIISTDVSSSVVAEGADVITGASLTALTVKVKVSESVYSESLTETSTVMSPL